jgi:hypothetical protein
MAPQWVAAPKAQVSTEIRAVDAAFGEQCRRDDAHVIVKSVGHMVQDLVPAATWWLHGPPKRRPKEKGPRSLST